MTKDATLTNKTLIVTRPSTDEVMLVIAVVLDPASLDIEQLLSALVPEMARGSVRGGLLVVGDSTLVIRLQDGDVMVDEVDTTRLLALADIDDDWSQEQIVEMMQLWIEVMRGTWRDRLEGQLRDLLVPNVVAGLAGDVELADGIWGMQAHRLVDPS